LARFNRRLETDAEAQQKIERFEKIVKSWKSDPKLSHEAWHIFVDGGLFGRPTALIDATLRGIQNGPTDQRAIRMVD